MDKTYICGISKKYINNYDVYKVIIDHLICPLCLNVLFDPIECNLCQTVMCRNCYFILKSAGKNCINEECKGTYTKANRLIRNFLSDLTIKCYICNKDNINYDNYINHIKICNKLNVNNNYDNAFKIINCVCNNKFDINSFNKHYKECFYFKSKFKELDDKIVILLKQYLINEEDFYYLIFIFKKFIQQIKSILKKNLDNDIWSTKLMNKKLEKDENSINDNSVNDLKKYYNNKIRKSIIDGNLEEYKEILEGKYGEKFNIFEDVSKDKSKWTPLHVAMNYGKWEIIKYIMEDLKKNNLIEIGFKLKTDDGMCPLLCLLKSPDIIIFKKKAIFEEIVTKYAVPVSEEVKNELKSKGIDDLIENE